MKRINEEPHLDILFLDYNCIIIWELKIIAPATRNKSRCSRGDILNADCERRDLLHLKRRDLLHLKHRADGAAMFALTEAISSYRGLRLKLRGTGPGPRREQGDGGRDHSKRRRRRHGGGSGGHGRRRPPRGLCVAAAGAARGKGRKGGSVQDDCAGGSLRGKDRGRHERVERELGEVWRARGDERQEEQLGDGEEAGERVGRVAGDGEPVGEEESGGGGEEGVEKGVLLLGWEEMGAVQGEREQGAGGEKACVEEKRGRLANDRAAGAGGKGDADWADGPRWIYGAEVWIREKREEKDEQNDV